MSLVINTCGGGGGGASFAVYGYKEEKTTAGSANDIQVYSADDMTDYVISYSEPETPTEGLVWMSVGGGKFEFQPIDNTPVYIPVSSAKIYRSGVWEDVNVKCYINGVWEPDVIYYYNSGSGGDNWAIAYGSSYVTFAKYTEFLSLASKSSGIWWLDCNAEIKAGSTYYIEYTSTGSTSAYFRACIDGTASSTNSVQMPTATDKSIVSFAPDSSTTDTSKTNTLRIYYSGTGANIKIYRVWEG